MSHTLMIMDDEAIRAIAFQIDRANNVIARVNPQMYAYLFDDMFDDYETRAKDPSRWIQLELFPLEGEYL